MKWWEQLGTMFEVELEAELLESVFPSGAGNTTGRAGWHLM